MIPGVVNFDRDEILELIDAMDFSSKFRCLNGKKEFSEKYLDEVHFSVND